MLLANALICRWNNLRRCRCHKPNHHPNCGFPPQRQKPAYSPSCSCTLDKAAWSFGLAGTIPRKCANS